MTNRKLLLTGASGFLGSALVPELLDAGFEIKATSRKRITSVNTINWIHGDITNLEFIARAVEGCDIVVHAAGKTGTPQHAEDRLEFFKVNSTAAAVLAKAARQAGVKQFIHVSSTGVFGYGTGIFTEDSCCKPANVYEESKLAGEAAVLAEASAMMNVLVIRPSNIFGERHPRNKLLTWLRSVKQGHAVLVWPIDRNQVNYVYVGDVARAITALAKMNINNDGEANAAIYIINTPATMQQFYEASASAIGVPAKAWVVPKWPLSTIATLFDSLSSVTGWRLPLTKNKIKELSNQQIFEVSKLKRKQPHFPYFGLHEGLRRICIDYRERGLL